MDIKCGHLCKAMHLFLNKTVMNPLGAGNYAVCIISQNFRIPPILQLIKGLRWFNHVIFLAMKLALPLQELLYGSQMPLLPHQTPSMGILLHCASVPTWGGIQKKQCQIVTLVISTSGKPF